MADKEYAAHMIELVALQRFQARRGTAERINLSVDKLRQAYEVQKTDEPEESIAFLVKDAIHTWKRIQNTRVNTVEERRLLMNEYGVRNVPYLLTALKESR